MDYLANEVSPQPTQQQPFIELENSLKSANAEMAEELKTIQSILDKITPPLPKESISPLDKLQQSQWYLERMNTNMHDFRENLNILIGIRSQLQRLI